MIAFSSPSLGREWIEICCHLHFYLLETSPSLGREWIEIALGTAFLASVIRSPSLGREWIEILSASWAFFTAVVSLLGEGVD